MNSSVTITYAINMVMVCDCTLCDFSKSNFSGKLTEAIIFNVKDHVNFTENKIQMPQKR